MTLHEIFLVMLGFVLGWVARRFFCVDPTTERLLMKRLLEERAQRMKQ